MKILNLLVLIFFNFVCSAENYQKPNVPTTDWIKKIENYFNDELDSVKSNFTQVGSRGNVSTGKIFLKRKKGLLKLYYDDPNTNIAIVKDYKLTHFDRDLKEKTVISVYSSPLAFFLEKKVDLKNNTKVASLDESQNSVQITLKKNGDEDEGAITLLFSKKPFQLKGWVILENNDYGRQTQIILESAQFNAEFSDKEFDSFSLITDEKK
ncbi:MAG: outer membrane lipoprotein carrier protein LolA [Alphaproteobacteria bacterium]|nr:outer membrane lipoprotein carrier protein LolA [Alphaproteobacteria bacterium]